MAVRLYRWAQWVTRHRRRVLGAWLLLLLVVVGLGTTLRGRISTEFTVPAVESQRAQNLLGSKFPESAGGVARVVLQAPAGSDLTAQRWQTAIATSLRRAAGVPGVLQVTDPVQGGTLAMDRTIGYADVRFRQLPGDIPQSAKDRLHDAMEPARAAGLRVEFAGSASSAPAELGGPAEGLGVILAYAVLAVTLTSLLAAGLPLITALVGVGIGVLGVQFVSRYVQMTNTATALALMLGLAVGIDYALFIVARHREQLSRPGSDVGDCVARAVATAGSAVFFAGVTVIVALSALAITGIPFLTVMGLAAAATVLVAILVALTLVPAVLSMAGERLRPRGMSTHSDPAHRPKTPGRWGSAWGRAVSRAPWAVVLTAVLALLTLAVPARELRLGLPSDETQPKTSTQHKSYELLAKGFGPGFNASLVVVADTAHLAASDRPTAIRDLTAALAKDPDVVTVTRPVVNRDGTVAVVGLVPRTGPDDPATIDMVHRLREHATTAVKKAGGTAYVAGATAGAIDVSGKLSAAMPLFLSVIVALAVLLLALAFRSVLVPLKAVLGFLLSIAATLGTVVWVFQQGHLVDAFQIAAAAPVVSFLPVLLISVLFGLAMDYEVFLVSRMREYFLATGDAQTAVVRSLARSGRVIAAAALIMTAVFGSFVFNRDPVIKSIGFALAVGVFVDAFVIRLTVVPAVMCLLGRRAWRLPRWLERVLPNVDIEGADLPSYRAAQQAANQTDVPAAP
ncbi:MMPL family transporter [Streptomyces sp. NPDC046197]|uniref:MMPL family transporter n=1 Tax=Streptomyces sp. NPDC046197 TaxID=3154337 RepID=UPI0033E6AE2A